MLFMIVNVHITRISDETFRFLALPLMSLGLVPIGFSIYHVLSNKLSIMAKLVIACFLSFLLGLGEFCLIIMYGIWFHFAIGGSL
jgi:hypothetical protein